MNELNQRIAEVEKELSSLQNWVYRGEEVEDFLFSKDECQTLSGILDWDIEFVESYNNWENIGLIKQALEDKIEVKMAEHKGLLLGKQAVEKERRELLEKMKNEIKIHCYGYDYDENAIIEGIESVFEQLNQPKGEK